MGTQRKAPVHLAGLSTVGGKTQEYTCLGLSDHPHLATFSGSPHRFSRLRWVLLSSEARVEPLVLLPREYWYNVLRAPRLVVLPININNQHDRTVVVLLFFQTAQKSSSKSLMTPKVMNSSFWLRWSKKGHTGAVQDRFEYLIGRPYCYFCLLWQVKIINNNPRCLAPLWRSLWLP